MIWVEGVGADVLEGHVLPDAEAFRVAHEYLDGHLILDRASGEDRKRVFKELRERTLAGGS